MLPVAALEEVNANNRNAGSVKVGRNGNMVSVARIVHDGHGANLVAAMSSSDVKSVPCGPRSEEWVKLAVTHDYRKSCLAFVHGAT